MSTLRSKDPKIAFFDVETMPILGFTWGTYDTNVIHIVRDTYMACFSVKWLGKDGVTTYALPDFPLYKKDPHNDRDLMHELHKFMTEAEIIIAHNGDQFDIKKSNARMIIHGLNPPEPYKTVDTLKLARRNFKFTSNKLNDLAKNFGLGEKIKHQGIDLWIKCMNGDPEAWKLMRKYNKHDVVLLEEVYLKLRPWAATLHPDMGIASGGCPRCGSTERTPKSTFLTKHGRKQVYFCENCHHHYSKPYESNN